MSKAQKGIKIVKERNDIKEHKEAEEKKHKIKIVMSRDKEKEKEKEKEKVRKTPTEKDNAKKLGTKLPKFVEQSDEKNEAQK